MKFFRLLAGVQGTYFLLTGLWPLVHIDSFIAVTGYKTDIWLVKTVGALLLPMSLTLLYYAARPISSIPAIILGASSALAFIIIDCHYAWNNTIPDIYLLDAAAEALILIGWFIVIVTKTKADTSKTKRPVRTKKQRLIHILSCWACAAVRLLRIRMRHRAFVPSPPTPSASRAAPRSGLSTQSLTRVFPSSNILSYLVHASFLL